MLGYIADAHGHRALGEDIPPVPPPPPVALDEAQSARLQGDYTMTDPAPENRARTPPRSLSGPIIQSAPRGSRPARQASWR